MTRWNYHESFYLDSATSPPVFNQQYSTDWYIDVRDYGAVGDYDYTTGTGTDNTAAIQAAIDSTTFGGVHVGRQVRLPPGRFKTTSALTLYQSTSLVGTDLLRTTPFGAGSGGTAIEFHGGTNENCVEAIGSGGSSVSRVAVQGFRIHDRRTSPAGGNGVYFEEVVNQTIVREMDILGFPTGASVKITATSGNSSDCVIIDDLWTLLCQYGLHLSSLDNNVLIRGIKGDTPSTTGVASALIYLGSSSQAAVMIEGVKHENTESGVPTIIVDGAQQNVLIDGVVSRTGVGGPVVKITDSGVGVTCRNLSRSHSGVMLDVTGAATPYSITTTRLAQWVGGNDKYRLNNAALVGGVGASDNDRIYTEGKLYAATAALTGGDEGKLNVQADSTTQKGLVVRAPASTTADMVRVYDATGSALLVNSAGSTFVRGLATSGAFTTSKRTTVADANYTILATDHYVAVTSLSAPRTLTLPSAATAGAGFRLIIKDESGAAGTHNMTVPVAGGSGQTVDGAASVAVAANYGTLRLISTGSNWSVI